jgi:hypothetical protein
MIDLDELHSLEKENEEAEEERLHEWDDEMKDENDK